MDDNLSSLIVSLQLLLEDPVAWSARQNWFVRWLLVGVFAVSIGVVSISLHTWYQAQKTTQEQDDQIQPLIQQLVTQQGTQSRLLETILRDLHRHNQSITNHESVQFETTLPLEMPISATIEASSAAMALEQKQHGSLQVYLKTETETIGVYASPQATQPMTTVSTGMFFEGLATQEGWLEIRLNPQQTGRVRSEAALVFNN